MVFIYSVVRQTHIESLLGARTTLRSWDTEVDMTVSWPFSSSHSRSTSAPANVTWSDFAYSLPATLGVGGALLVSVLKELWRSHHIGQSVGWELDRLNLPTPSHKTFSLSHICKTGIDNACQPLLHFSSVNFTPPINAPSSVKNDRNCLFRKQSICLLVKDFCLIFKLDMKESLKNNSNVDFYIFINYGLESLKKVWMIFIARMS